MFSHLLLFLFLFVLLSFWFYTHKREDYLSHAAEWSPSHPCQHCDGQVNAEHQADPTGFLPVLIYPPVASIQSPIQPMESLKIGLYPPQGPGTKPPIFCR